MFIVTLIHSAFLEPFFRDMALYATFKFIKANSQHGGPSNDINDIADDDWIKVVAIFFLSSE